MKTSVENTQDAEIAQPANALIMFDINDAQIAEMKAEYAPLKISGPNDKTGYELVRMAKANVVAVRTNLEKMRNVKNEKALKFQRDCNAEAKRLRLLLEEVEEPLTAEKARIDAEIQAEKDRRQQEINDRVNLRMAALNAVNGAGSVRYELIPGMPEADFQAHLAVATAKHEETERIKAEQEAEIARLRKADEERKAKEAEALEIQRKEMVEAQTKLDAQRKDQEAKEAALKAEADRLDREKREADDKKRREEEAKVHAAEIEKAREEAAAKAKKEAEEVAQRKAKEESEARVRAEAEAKEAARKEEARRSDKEKLEVYLSAIRKVPIPNIRDAKLQGVLVDFTNSIVALDKAIG